MLPKLSTKNSKLLIIVGIVVYFLVAIYLLWTNTSPFIGGLMLSAAVLAVGLYAIFGRKHKLSWYLSRISPNTMPLRGQEQPRRRSARGRGGRVADEEFDGAEEGYEFPEEGGGYPEDADAYPGGVDVYPEAACCDADGEAPLDEAFAGEDGPVVYRDEPIALDPAEQLVEQLAEQSAEQPVGQPVEQPAVTVEYFDGPIVYCPPADQPVEQPAVTVETLVPASPYIGAVLEQVSPDDEYPIHDLPGIQIPAAQTAPQPAYVHPDMVPDDPFEGSGLFKTAEFPVVPVPAALPQEWVVKAVTAKQKERAEKALEALGIDHADSLELALNGPSASVQEMINDSLGMTTSFIPIEPSAGFSSDKGKR